MADLLNQKRAIRLLDKHGWRQARGSKHSVKMMERGHRPITLPRHRGADYDKELTKRILRQAGLR